MKLFLVFASALALVSLAHAQESAGHFLRDGAGKPAAPARLLQAECERKQDCSEGVCACPDGKICEINSEKGRGWCTVEGQCRKDDDCAALDCACREGAECKA